MKVIAMGFTNHNFFVIIHSCQKYHKNLNQHSSVSRAFMRGTRVPSFEPHQYTGKYVEEIGSPAILGHQGVSRCDTRGEFSGYVLHVCLCQAQMRLPSLALKPRLDIKKVQNRHISGNIKRLMFS